jgi:hypothetical protein
MRVPLNSVRFWPPLPLVQGERIEVRGSKTVRALKPQTLTLPSPFGRERRTKVFNPSNTSQTRPIK